MHSFSEQCLDMARSMLGHNLESIQPDGTILPANGEQSRPDEPGHVALALGEFYRATGETTLKGHDIVDLAARCITAQMFTEPPAENGLAYASLGLLCFGPSKERNPVWERLVDETRERIDKALLHRSDYDNHWQAFNVAKAVARFSLGLSKKDETSRLIERMVERMTATSSAGFFDDATGQGMGGNFNLYGVMSFVFIRSALQLHANSGVRDRKLPTLRTYAEKYIKTMPDLVRADGLGWAFGRAAGAYGQMHCISLILQGLRDGWIADDQKIKYYDILRRLFMFFYQTYLDQDHGFLDLRDEERTAYDAHTTRMANFDAARYLCQWSRLAKTIGGDLEVVKPANRLAVCRFFSFDKSPRKEQGLLSYQDPASGLHIILPLVSSGSHRFSDSLAFPHMPGVFDWPSNQQTSPFIPEFTIAGKVYTPSFYGKNAQVAMGTKAGTYHFRYDQPDLIDRDEKVSTNIASLKVDWEFNGGRIVARFTLTAKSAVMLEDFRLVLPIAATHSRMTPGNSLVLGAESHRCEVIKDDFHATWDETKVVSDNPKHRTCWGKVHFYQTLQRDKSMPLRAGMTYAFEIAYQPHIVRAGDAV